MHRLWLSVSHFHPQSKTHWIQMLLEFEHLETFTVCTLEVCEVVVENPNLLHWQISSGDLFPWGGALGLQWCLDGYCMSSGIYINVRTQGFSAEHCIVTRWSMIFSLPVSHFNVVTNWYLCQKTLSCHILGHLVAFNSTLRLATLPLRQMTHIIQSRLVQCYCQKSCATSDIDSIEGLT